jgi:sterol desaturase/sphingolipid hydroxylase (fatty acid hydroxylase superfamily)
MPHDAIAVVLQAWQALYAFAICHGVAMVLLTWVTSGLGAVFAYWQNHRGERLSLGGLIRFCVPREMLTHRSLRLDIGYCMVLQLGFPILVAPVLIGNFVIATAVYRELTNLFGPAGQADASLALWLGLVAACVVAHDCVQFHLHYAYHKVAVLWETHKVHHSTEFLVPISNRRLHPLQELADSGGTAVVVGGLLAVVSYTLGLRLQNNLIAGADAYFMVNIFSFYHLRHSHVRLTYGWLERVLLSPTQHQIHHAYDTHLWDKNFGLLLSVWDQLWGTIVYSEAAPVFHVGLPEAYRSDYDTVWKLFLMPLRRIAEHGWRAAAAARLRAAAWSSSRQLLQRDAAGARAHQPDGGDHHGHAAGNQGEHALHPEIA